MISSIIIYYVNNGEKIGCFHNKPFLKKKISLPMCIKRQLLINLGTRIKKFVCLAKETIVFSHLLATSIIMIKTHGQQTALQIFIS